MGAAVCHTGAAHHRQADPDDEAGGEGALRGGVDGPVARREGGRQGVLHHRGGELVQGDGDLPDLPHEARQHTGYVVVYTALNWFILVLTRPSLLGTTTYWVRTGLYCFKLVYTGPNQTFLIRHDNILGT